MKSCSKLTDDQVDATRQVLNGIITNGDKGTFLGSDVITSLYATSESSSDQEDATCVPDHKVLSHYFKRLRAQNLIKSPVEPHLKALLPDATKCSDPQAKAKRTFLLATFNAMGVERPKDVPCETPDKPNPKPKPKPNSKPKPAPKPKPKPEPCPGPRRGKSPGWWIGLLVGMIVLVIVLAIVLGIAAARSKPAAKTYSESPGREWT